MARLEKSAAVKRAGRGRWSGCRSVALKIETEARGPISQLEDGSFLVTAEWFAE
jgi:hypothetical protein